MTAPTEPPAEPSFFFVLVADDFEDGHFSLPPCSATSPTKLFHSNRAMDKEGENEPGQFIFDLSRTKRDKVPR